MENILAGLGGGQGFLQGLMGGGQGGLLGLLGGGGGGQPPGQPQDPSLTSMLGLGGGLLSQPGQSSLQTFGNMMQPMGLINMIMKGLQG
jgi:hypothetical protein